MPASVGLVSAGDPAEQGEASGRAVALPNDVLMGSNCTTCIGSATRAARSASLSVKQGDGLDPAQERLSACLVCGVSNIAPRPSGGTGRHFAVGNSPSAIHGKDRADRPGRPERQGRSPTAAGGRGGGRGAARRASVKPGLEILRPIRAQRSAAQSPHSLTEIPMKTADLAPHAHRSCATRPCPSCRTIIAARSGQLRPAGRPAHPHHLGPDQRLRRGARGDPFKGQVLTQTARYWFERRPTSARTTSSLSRPERGRGPASGDPAGGGGGSGLPRRHHLHVGPDALPAGERDMYGHRFPDGMRPNERLPWRSSRRPPRRSTVATRTADRDRDSGTRAAHVRAVAHRVRRGAGAVRPRHGAGGRARSHPGRHEIRVRHRSRRPDRPRRRDPYARQ